jgi:hypothetical protein
MEFNKLASTESLERTSANLKEHNFEPIVVETKEEALAKIKELIPNGASVMNGTSESLRQIGYVDYLKSGKHKWNNLHEVILAEPDPAKQALLRRQSVVSDYYVGSMHALTETGEIIIASNTGSQLPHSAFTSPNLIFVVGSQKITPTLNDGLDRINEHVVPLEDERMKQVYGFGTTYAKTLIMHKENPMMGRSIRIILVKESLGF